MSALPESVRDAPCAGGHLLATINVPITTLELTIEIAEGANGPVQDTLQIERALILTN